MYNEGHINKNTKVKKYKKVTPLIANPQNTSKPLFDQKVLLKVVSQAGFVELRTV